MTAGTLPTRRPTGRPATTQPRTHVPLRPADSPAATAPTAPGTAPARRRPRRSSRLGSRQQVSIRGRRVNPMRRADATIMRWTVALVIAAIAGIASIMYLSGVTTDQSFDIADARQRSAGLSNELESLQRDVAFAQSSANLAKEASRLGMVAPNQVGVLNAQGNQVDEVRPADSTGSRPVIDVNGESRRSGATSDPGKTQSIPGLVPQSIPGVMAGTGTVPYADRRPTPSPASQAVVPSPAASVPAPAVPAPAPVPAAASPAPRIPAPAPAPAPVPAPESIPPASAPAP